MDWLFAVLYPSTQTSVATPAALPAVGNTVNDMRVVQDDGDGSAASYRWEQREGDVAAKWYKIYDMDWGYDSILSGFLNHTQDVYTSKYGRNDIDDTGALLTGINAGQHLYGGKAASSHLTLHANSGDGTGAQTGYIQAADNVRPQVDSSVSLGTTAERWLKVWTDDLTSGTLTMTSGSITDSSGTISFGDENLVTTGSVDATTGLFGATSTLSLASGSITDTSGAISFGDENLSTTGSIAAGTLSLAAGSITDSSGAISFGDENLTTTGTLSAGTITGTQLNIDNLRLDGNTVSITQTNGNLILAADGTGVVNVTSAMTTIGQTITGTATVTGQLNADNLRLDGNTLSSTDANGNVIIDPNGAGLVELGAAFFPTTDSSWDIGKTGNVWNKLWIDGSIGGATEIALTTLLSLRDILSGIADGYTITWSNASSKFVATAPDAGVDHGATTGLGDDDHTQYALLAGRAGGQSLIGGTAAGDDLTLTSTSNGTLGNIFLASVAAPSVDATWDLGTALLNFKDLYLTGQLIGARVENYSTAGRPSASAGTIGRLYYDTTVADVYVDRGGTWKKLSLEKYVIQDPWNGLTTNKTYDVSSEISDARECIWMFKNNSDDFKQMLVEITMTQTHVTVTSSFALAAATYTLIGVG